MTESDVGFATAITRQNSGISKEFDESGGVNLPAGMFVAEVIVTFGKFSFVRSSHLVALAWVGISIMHANKNTEASLRLSCGLMALPPQGVAVFARVGTAQSEFCCRIDNNSVHPTVVIVYDGEFESLRT